ncbi:MAG: CPBP family intramembrane metalloprotease, partial [Chloroflexi bacterium]|nr:CPBP family intramembrane metalloprotease [Chloroflexota bacterium]
FFLSTLVGLVVAIALTWLFRRFLDRKGFLDLGLRLRKGWLAQTLWGVLLGILLMAFVFAAEWLGGWLLPQGLALDMLPAILGYLALYVIVAINEELVFRGYALQTLQQGWGRGGALVASSFLFALFHSLNPNFSWLGFLGIFLAGILLGYGYLATGALWLPMGLHFAWNFAEGPIFSFAVSGLESPGLVVWQELRPDTLWTGGSFGPEAGILGFLAILLGLAALWFRSKQAPRSTK